MKLQCDPHPVPSTYHKYNSYNMGTSALPDMYARSPRAEAIHIRQSRVPMLQLIYYTSSTLKICPKLDVDISVCLYSHG